MSSSEKTQIDTRGRGHEALHGWFGLSYAQYLSIPRSVLQSMPDNWQRKFARLLRELDDSIDWRPKVGAYQVRLRVHTYEFDEDKSREVGVWGAELDDPLHDYNRGRRRLPLLESSP